MDTPTHLSLCHGNHQKMCLFQVVPDCSNSLLTKITLFHRHHKPQTFKKGQVVTNHMLWYVHKYSPEIN